MCATDCPRNERASTGVVGGDEATDKQIISSGFWSTFCAEGSQRRL